MPPKRATAASQSEALFDQCDPQIHNVGLRGSGLQQSPDLRQAGIGIVCLQKIVEVELSILRPLKNSGIDHASRRIGRAVFSIGAPGEQTEACHVFFPESPEPCQNDFLIAAPFAGLRRGREVDDRLAPTQDTGRPVNRPLPVSDLEAKFRQFDSHGSGNPFIRRAH